MSEDTQLKNFEEYEKLTNQVTTLKKELSKYARTQEKIKDLKKQAETERKAEVVKILEQNCGKIKDLAVFEQFIKTSKDFIRKGLRGAQMNANAVADNKTPDIRLLEESQIRRLQVGKIVEETACEISDMQAWQDYLRQYQGYIRKTQGKG